MTNSLSEVTFYTGERRYLAIVKPRCLHYDFEWLQTSKRILKGVNDRKSADIGDSLHLVCTTICQCMAGGICDGMVVGERLSRGSYLRSTENTHLWIGNTEYISIESKDSQIILIIAYHLWHIETPHNTAL